MGKALIILGLGLLLRILLSHTLTFFHDFYTFQFWSLDLVQLGFAGFYSAIRTDYLPGYLYVLMFVGKVFYWFLNHGILLDMQLVYKLPSIMADIGNSWLIYLLAKRFLSPKLAFWTLVFAVFNPSLIANSTLWGQVDSLISFFILLSVYLLLEQKFELSALVLGLAQTIKPVAVLVLPIFLIWAYYSHVPRQRIVRSAVIFFGIFLVAFIPFFSEGTFLQFVWDRLMITTNYNPAISLNAFNFWGLVTAVTSPSWSYVPDDTIFLLISLKNWGYLLCTAGFVFILLKFRRLSQHASEPDRNFFLLLTIHLLYFIFFLFFTRLHERHLYYSLIFLTICFFHFRTWWQKLLVGLPFVIYLLNLYFSYSLIFARSLLLPSFVHYLSPLLLLLSLGYLFYYLNGQSNKTH